MLSHISTCFSRNPDSWFWYLHCLLPNMPKELFQKSLKYFLFKLFFTFFFSFTTNHKICSNYTCSESGSLCSLHHLQNTAFAFSLEKAPLTGSPLLARKQSRNSEHEAHFHIAIRKGCSGLAERINHDVFSVLEAKVEKILHRRDSWFYSNVYICINPRTQYKYKLHTFESTLLQKEILRSPHKIN